VVEESAAACAGGTDFFMASTMDLDREVSPGDFSAVVGRRAASLCSMTRASLVSPSWIAW
jgi:hypothetical protein